MEYQKSQYLYHPKFRDAWQIGNVLSAAKDQKPDLKIGFANGKFLYPHPHHSVFLARCKSNCSILVVGINSDYSLKEMGYDAHQIKFGLRERAFMLANFEFVDYVVGFDEETPFKAISELGAVDVIFKGPDYAGKEYEVVSAGREVEIIEHPFEVHSTDVLDESSRVSTGGHFDLSGVE